MRTRKQKRVVFAVSFALPESATIAEAKTYVDESVCTWRGSLRPPGSYDDDDPGDPMFGLDCTTIQVRRIK